MAKKSDVCVFLLLSNYNLFCTYFLHHFEDNGYWELKFLVYISRRILKYWKYKLSMVSLCISYLGLDELDIYAFLIRILNFR